MAASDCKQGEFAKRVGINQASISRYLNESNRPDVENLEKLCSILDPAERADLVGSFLLDDIPPSARYLVRVITDSPKVQEEPPPSVRNHLPPKVRAAMDLLEKLAAESKEVADWLVDTADLLSGR